MGLFDFLGTNAEFKNGSISQKGTGILGWIGENPALFTGLTTAALGSSQGMQNLDALSLGAQAGSGTQQNIQSIQMQAAQRAALQAQAQLEQQKLLLDIEKAKQETRLGNVDAALKSKQAEQDLINKAYDTASKLYPNDPAAAQKHAQYLILQNTKGGNITVGGKKFGLLGSRADNIIYTPAQQTGIANSGDSGTY